MRTMKFSIALVIAAIGMVAPPIASAASQLSYASAKRAMQESGKG
jgi:hypothetical protein